MTDPTSPAVHLIDLEKQELRKQLELGRSLSSRRGDPTFLFELRDLGISKTRVYELMAQAEFVDRLVASGQLHEEAVLQIQPKALKLLKYCGDDAVRQVCEVASDGQLITHQLVKKLADEESATSSLLPKAVRAGVAAGWIPAKKAAAFTELLAQLPAPHHLAITQPLEDRATAEDVAGATATARALVKASNSLAALNGIDPDQILAQALKGDAAMLLADALTAAEKARTAAHQLQVAQQQLARVLNILRPDCPTGTALAQVVAQLEGLAND